MDTPTLAPAPTAAPAYAGPMTWADVVAHPSLRDLPFKVELDSFGCILMSPASNRHSLLQGRIERLLGEHLGGEAFPECAITTLEGVRVPDVVWMSDARVEAMDLDELTLHVAPEICVEVRSPSNVWAEMEEKVQIHLAKGAQEGWICEVDGAMRYFGYEGERGPHALASDFPTHIPLPGRPS